MPSMDNRNRRAHTSTRKAGGSYFEIIDTRTGVTKAEMKEIEAKRVRELRHQGHPLPQNKENDRRHRADYDEGKKGGYGKRG